METRALVYVELDGRPVLVGRLWARMRKGRDSASFEYDDSWLERDERFALEPALQLGSGVFHTPKSKPLFGGIGDSAPDRWGRVLMRRAERRGYTWPEGYSHGGFKMRLKVSVTASLAVILGALCMVPPVAAGTPHAVDVQDFSFNPDDLTIEVGETVQWSNLGGTHNIVADDSSFSSGAPDGGAWTFDHTFNDEGTFAYHCTLHGGPGGVGMAGVITVQGAGDQGSVTVIKTTVGGDDTFEFSSDLPDNTEFSITTTGGSGQHGPVTVDAGTYAVTESNPPGWILAAASCDNGDTPDEITVGAGEDVICTFDNRPVTVYEDRFEDTP